MREKILFDDSWLFHEGDINTEYPKDKGPVYVQSKTERKVWGPAAIHYTAVPNDFDTKKIVCTEKWERVTLPHDYVIRHNPCETENNALGYFKYDNAWYRKKFKLSDSDKGKRITLLFEGVATHATVY